MIGTIATGPDLIETGWKVHLPALYQHIRRKYFTAKDIGRNIRRQRIDVYTGEGSQARRVAHGMTAKNQQAYLFICLPAGVIDPVAGLNAICTEKNHGTGRMRISLINLTVYICLAWANV